MVKTVLYDYNSKEGIEGLGISFPDMSPLKNVTFDSKRSGLIMFRIPKEELKNQQNILLAEPPGGIVPDPVSNYKNKTDFAECRDLWLNHGCSVDLLYGDDGEMQCNNMKIHRPIDFLREPIDKIKKALPASKPTRKEYVEWATNVAHMIKWLDSYEDELFDAIMKMPGIPKE
jgi:hypothetical protein